MLVLKSIKKDYVSGTTTVHALKGINLTFRKNEFVSILGPSGCGKTTLLNLIGGLDQYTSGDLVIQGKSTKKFKNSDWDAYRNASVGFVFQNYNLISHLSVLNNVEMALSLSGVSQAERKRRAKKALTDVGLSDQFNKKPNQLSGGQMQRVAIARALVNDPDILLADEPTGALDSKTSEQIMALIQAISKDRLVIMVTHNADIAHQYSDRIIELLDGEVLSDTNPEKDPELPDSLTLKKTNMNYVTALISSFKNLFTKKTRTFITTLAGSIGIIGVALVLGISNGTTDYIDTIESDTLSGFPVTVDQFAIAELEPDGPGGILAPNATSERAFTDAPTIYSYDQSSSSTLHQNVFTDDFLDYIDDMDSSFYNSLTYTTQLELNILTLSEANTPIKVEIGSESNGPFAASNSVFEIPDNEEFILSQYDLLEGSFPNSANEAVLVVGTENELSVEFLESIGLDIESEYAFSDLLNKSFKVIPNDLYYVQNDTRFVASSDLESMYDSPEAIELNIVGILRLNADASSELLNPGIGYTSKLTDIMVDDALESAIVQAQLSDSSVNVLTGLPFNEVLTYDDVLGNIGGDSRPLSIQIYPVSFESKDDIKAYIDAYNETVTGDNIIVYTDIAESISSTIGELVDNITIILASFAGISLVVSSIMIGIITYVSVIERTKEIGVMRSLGARKKDISRIFNAETILIGLAAGLLGIGIYFALQFPINILIDSLIDVQNFAGLDIISAGALIILSSFLTLFAGIVPARIAANKDPVEALRTE